MKLLFLSGLILLSGCGYTNRLYTHWTGDLTYKCSVSGVQYVQADSGLAVHLDRDGKPIPCK